MHRLWFCYFALTVSGSLLTYCGGPVSDSDMVTFRQALEHYNRQEFAEAQSLARKVHSLPQARLMLAKIAYFSGDYQTAAREFKALAAEQQNPEALLGLAKTQRALKQGEESLAAVNQLIGLFPDSMEGWLLKGLLHEDANQIPDAIEAYKMATRLGHRVALAHGKLGLLYQKARLNEKAEHHFRIEEILK